LFTVLESQRKISKDDVSFLLQTLRQLRREDLARKVEHYCRESRLTRVAEDEVKGSTKAALSKLDSSTNIAVSMSPAAPSDGLLFMKQFSRSSDDGTNCSWHHDVIPRHCGLRLYTEVTSLQRVAPVEEGQVNEIQERLNHFVLPSNTQQQLNIETTQCEVEMPCYNMKRKPRG